MWVIKKYNQKKRVKKTIFLEFEKALEKKDYIRAGVLSKRFIKLDK
jgi:hypothetical protein